MNTLKALKRSSLGLDLYLWLVYRTFPLRAPLRLTWRHLYQQFGVHPANASDKNIVEPIPHACLARVEKDQAGLDGPELRHTSGRPDPAPLDSGDPSGGRAATTGPIAFRKPQEWSATGFGGGETTEFDGEAKNPHHGPKQGRTRGGSLDAVRALRPARAVGHRRSFVQEMPPAANKRTEVS